MKPCDECDGSGEGTPFFTLVGEVLIWLPQPCAACEGTGEQE